MQQKRVMVTGGTGYIGSWVVKMLLEKGYTVNLTIRDKSKKEKYSHLQEIEKKCNGKLILFEADLLKTGSYKEAMKGCEQVFHLASPFIINNIKDPQKQLIDPALKGTINVLSTASATPSVKQVILTSSVVAIYGDAIEMAIKKLPAFTEEQWNETSSLNHQPYSYSKTLAEKEAWKIEKEQQQWKLTVINPGFVMGPSLTSVTNSASIDFINDYLSGKLKTGVPKLEFGFVDVRDVAKAHILAAETGKTGRFICVDRSATMLEFAQLIEQAFPGKYKLPKNELPKFLLYLVGWTQGLTKRFIQRNVGWPLKFDNSKSQKELAMDYIALATTIKEHVEQIESE